MRWGDNSRQGVPEELTKRAWCPPFLEASSQKTCSELAKTAKSGWHERCNDGVPKARRGNKNSLGRLVAGWYVWR
jgi:hypothetical protein